MHAYDLVSEYKMQDGATATGNGTAWTTDTGGFNTLAMQVEGITTATITFEATVDGSNWVAVQATNLTSGTAATTATADGLYRLDVSGLYQVRARISAYTSGTINVTGRGQA
jgi:hypothetical protein